MANEKINLEILAKGKPALKAIDKVDKKTKKLGKTTKTTGSSMTDSWAKVGASILAVGFSLKKTTDAYEVQLKAELALTNAIRLNARQGEMNIDMWKKYASAMQDVTTFGDEALLKQIALTKTMGLTDEMAKKVIETAMDYSVAFDKDISSSVRELSQTLSGQMGTIKRTLPLIGDFTKEQLKAGKAIDAVAKATKGQAREWAKSKPGKLSQVWNAFGDVLEGIGKLVLQLVNHFGLLDGATKFFKGLAKSAEDTSVWFSELNIVTQKLLTAIGWLTLAIPGMAVLRGLGGTAKYAAGHFNKLTKAVKGYNKSTVSVSGKKVDSPVVDLPGVSPEKLEKMVHIQAPFTFTRTSGLPKPATLAKAGAGGALGVNLLAATEEKSLDPLEKALAMTDKMTAAERELIKVLARKFELEKSAKNNFSLFEFNSTIEAREKEIKLLGERAREIEKINALESEDRKPKLSGINEALRPQPIDTVTVPDEPQDWEATVKLFVELKESVANYSESISNAVLDLSELDKAQMSHQKHLDSLNKSFKDLDVSPQNQASLLAQSNGAFKRVSEIIKAQEALKKLQAHVNIIEGARDYNEELVNSVSNLSAVQQSTISHTRHMREWKKSLDDAKVSLADQTVLIDAANDAHLRQLDIIAENKVANLDSIQSFVKSWTDTDSLAQKSQEMWVSVFDGIGNHLTDMIMGVKTSFKDLARFITAQVIKMAVMQTIVAPIAGFFGLGAHTGKATVKHTGGILNKHAGGSIGGSIPSYHAGMRSDERLAKLQVGEGVVNRAGTRRNPGTIDAMNRGEQIGGDSTVVHVTYSPQINALDPRTAGVVIAENAPLVVGIIRQAFNKSGQNIGI